MSDGPRRPPGPLRAEARVWWRIGWLSFGGPAGQIALMQRLLVEERRWISLERFLAGLDVCMLLPGPEAQQLATYVGWTRHGWRGGLVAGGLFVLPGAAVMFALSWLYVTWGSLPLVEAAFGGLQCAVVAIVVRALVSIGRRALGSMGALAIALTAFLALGLVGIPFPALVVAGAIAGLLLPLPAPSPASARGADHPAANPGSSRANDAGEVPRHAAGTGEDVAAAGQPRPVRAFGSVAVGTVLAAAWGISLLALRAVSAPGAEVAASHGPAALLAGIGARYAELALVSFGGAYALLAALAERAVADGWLTAAQMADGLALAETTPGPLILVLQFVAFVAVHGAGGGLGWALAAGAASLWVLFAPSFVWIFLAAPRLDDLLALPRLRRAMRGVSAVVVGVILHLSLWLAAHVLFDRVNRRPVAGLELVLPDPGSLDAGALVTIAVATLLLVAARQSLGRVLALSAALGAARLLLP